MLWNMGAWFGPDQNCWDQREKQSDEVLTILSCPSCLQPKMRCLLVSLLVLTTHLLKPLYWSWIQTIAVLVYWYTLYFYKLQYVQAIVLVNSQLYNGFYKCFLEYVTKYRRNSKWLLLTSYPVHLYSITCCLANI